jgi:hypothetical protein
MYGVQNAMPIANVNFEVDVNLVGPYNVVLNLMSGTSDNTRIPLGSAYHDITGGDVQHSAHAGISPSHVTLMGCHSDIKHRHHMEPEIYDRKMSTDDFTDNFKLVNRLN